MTKARIDVQLEIAVEGREVSARVAFRNGGPSSAALYKPFACFDGVQEADCFTITSAGGRVPYVGRLVKRSAPGAGDFLALGPGETHRTTCRLDQAYRFPPGAGSYGARYEALHPLPEGPGFVELTSNESGFEIGR